MSLSPMSCVEWGEGSVIQHSAVDVGCDAGAIAREIAGKEEAGAGDVSRPADAAERDVARDLGPALGAQLVLVDVGGDQARGDAVDADVVGAELARHRARQA